MDYIRGVVVEFKSKGIIIDTNLLVLFIAGGYDIAYIEKCSRTKNKGYTRDDYIFINNFLGIFDKIYVTPHILAEFSNISFNNINNKEFLKYFEIVVKIIKGMSEEYISKDVVLKIPMFKKFGFADTSIYELAKKNNLPVITDEFDLHHYLITKGMTSINMDHIRVTKWLNN
jgi:rRNA-processing protein FCF1